MGFITQFSLSLSHYFANAGILALLDEKENELQVFALERLNEITDTFWPEIADYIQKIEKFEENKEFPKRELAALVVSKVYFHLGSYLDSLTYALRAGSLMHKDPNNLYIDTIKVHAIDHYIKLRSEKDTKMDPCLEELLNSMFRRCIEDKHYRHAIGIALETHRMDWFKEAIMSSEDIVSSLTYSYKLAMQYISSRAFRDLILEELVALYQGLATPDYVNMCQCLIHLDKPHQVAAILDKLIKNDTLKTEQLDNELMAYQIGFDLYESATQDLLSHVRQGIRTTAPVPHLLKDDTKPVTTTTTTT
ncbi:unnamed protein product, partial [Meganyctiphanes norvegica]